jgi:glycosyltransferase involved in cell wall biosynthesis
MTSPAYNPKISIGIPTFNRRDYMLATVQSALEQTYANIEVIVSDNASTDDTWEHLKAISDPRLKLLHQSANLGMTGNFNATLHAATGDLFLPLSDDDLLAPTAIEKLSRPFREPMPGTTPQTVGLTWCPCININSEGHDLWQTRSGPLVESPVALLEGLFTGKRGTQFSATMIRTQDARDAGGYNDDRYGVLCDTGNWGKVALRYKHVVCIQEPLMRYRVHSASDTGHANCEDWQTWANHQILDFAAILYAQHDLAGKKRIERVRGNLLAQITVTVLMRYIGKPGWKSLFAREIWKARSFMFTPFVAKRVLKDGWKLLRLK